MPHVRKNYGESWGTLSMLFLVRVPAENQGCVCPAEAKGMRQRCIALPLAHLVGDQIDRSIDRWIVEIDRGRDNPIADCENREYCFDRTRSTEQMADTRFGRGHRNMAS